MPVLGHFHVEESAANVPVTRGFERLANKLAQFDRGFDSGGSVRDIHRTDCGH
jgi:hypothetical protein